MVGSKHTIAINRVPGAATKAKLSPNPTAIHQLADQTAVALEIVFSLFRTDTVMVHH